MTPEQSPAAGEPALREQIFAGFRGDVPALRPTFRYRLALGAVAAAMVLLPAVYLALVLAAGWMVFTYARFFVVELVPAARDGIAIALEVLPLLGLTPVLLALVKPLFVRFAKPAPPVRIDPGEEPLLFELVGRVCAALHAPMPTEIHADCQVNAAVLRPGSVLSPFRRRLILQLGLPLIEGLSLQQLAGVMAHELGHFSQKAGLRASGTIRAINFWLVRLAFHRDRFDHFVERLTRIRRSLFLRMYFQLLAFPVTLTHRILWLLMLTGQTLSAHLSRQMEYDADRYEVRLAGFSSLDFTMRELPCLNAASGLAISALQEHWKEKRLVDNFPRLVVATRRQSARAIDSQVERQIANERTQRFSTHPTIRQRIALALREKGVGVFASDLPATALFCDLAGLEQRASLAFYREQVGTQVEAASLIPTDDLQERQARRAAERGALDRFFQNPSALKGVPLPAELPPLDRPAALAQLARLRPALAARNERHALASQHYHGVAEERLVALQAEALLEAGFKLRPGQFNLPEGLLSLAQRAAAAAAAGMQSYGGDLAAFEEREVRRLLLALSLLGGEPAAEARRLLACAAFLGPQLPLLFGLRESLAVLDILHAQLKPDRSNPRLAKALDARRSRLHEQLKELHRALRGQAYPFDHARQAVNLAQFAIPAMPADGDLGRLAGTAEEAQQKLYEVYTRLLGRLAWLAEPAEAGLGAPSALPPAADAGAWPEVQEVPELPALPTLPAFPAPPLATAPSPEPAAAAIPESKADAVESRERFALYLSPLLRLRPFPLPAAFPAPGADSPAALAETRQAVAATLPGYTERARKYEQAERRYLRALRAEKLLAAGLSLPPADLDPDRDDWQILEEREPALAAMKALEPGLQAFEELQAHRFAIALALLEADPPPAAEIGRLRREAPPLLACLQAIQEHLPTLRELRRRTVVLDALGRQSQGASSPSLRTVVAAEIREVHRHLQELQRGLRGSPYPFTSPNEVPERAERTDLSHCAVPALPRQEQATQTFRAAGYAVTEMLDLHRRVVGRLARSTEAVEQALGGGG